MFFGIKFKVDSKVWLIRNINLFEFFIVYDFGEKSMGYKKIRLF